MPALSRRALAFLSLLAIVAVWGATFVVVKNALADAAPLTFNAMRMVLAFLVLVAVYHRHLPALAGGRSRRALGIGATVGFLLALGYSFQTLGLAHTTPTRSAFLTGTVVVLVPLFSAVPVLRPANARAPRWNTWLGAAVAFLGTALLTILKPVGPSLSTPATSNFGQVLTLFCAIAFALHILSLAHATRHVPFAQLALLQVGFAALWMTLAAAAFERTLPHWTMRLVAALAITAVFATALAFTVQSWAQNYLPATHTALLLALEPVFAWLTALLVLGEHLDRASTAGALLILAGIAITELWPARDTRREA